MIKVITKIITNNYQNSNSKKKKNIKIKISTTYPKIVVLKTYQSYKNTDAESIGNKTARHFLQY